MKQIDTSHIVFKTGAHAEDNFTKEYLEPLFADGSIPEYPGAGFYAICYGELCAYSDNPDQAPRALAVWSVEVLDSCDEQPIAVAREELKSVCFSAGWCPEL